MTDRDDRQHRSLLQRIARRAMLERGLLPDFPLQALAELGGILGPATRAEKSMRDLRNLFWCSIDNDVSRGLDQLTVTEAMPGGAVTIAGRGRTRAVALRYGRLQVGDPVAIPIEMVKALDVRSFAVNHGHRDGSAARPPMTRARVNTCLR
jgi:hypothetical protein